MSYFKKNRPVKVWSCLSDMSRIKLSKLGQVLFNSSDSIWPYLLTLPNHPYTHILLKKKKKSGSVKLHIGDSLSKPEIQNLVDLFGTFYYSSAEKSPCINLYL